MSPRQADKLIRSGRVIRLRSMRETFTAKIVSRDRWNVYTEDGGKFDRGDLELVEQQEGQ